MNLYQKDYRNIRSGCRYSKYHGSEMTTTVQQQIDYKMWVMCWQRYYVWDNIKRAQTDENAVCCRSWNSIHELPVLRASVLCRLLMSVNY